MVNNPPRKPTLLFRDTQVIGSGEVALFYLGVNGGPIEFSENQATPWRRNLEEAALATGCSPALVQEAIRQAVEKGPLLQNQTGFYGSRKVV